MPLSAGLWAQERGPESAPGRGRHNGFVGGNGSRCSGRRNHRFRSRHSRRCSPPRPPHDLPRKLTLAWTRSERAPPTPGMPKIFRHLVNAAFRPERFFIEADRTNPEKVRALLEKGKFLLAEDAGALVACVYVEVRGERGYFGLLAVDPARQRSWHGIPSDRRCRTVLPRRRLPFHGPHRRESAEGTTRILPASWIRGKWDPAFSRTTSILPKCPAIWSKCSNVWEISSSPTGQKSLPHQPLFARIRAPPRPEATLRRQIY